MGGGVPVVDDALDFAGDLIGEGADFVGDVIEEGVDLITENPELAAIALIIAGLPPELALSAEEAALAAETAAATLGPTVTAEQIAQNAIQNIIQSQISQAINEEIFGGGGGGGGGSPQTNTGIPTNTGGGNNLIDTSTGSGNNLIDTSTGDETDLINTGTSSEGNNFSDYLTGTLGAGTGLSLIGGGQDSQGNFGGGFSLNNLFNLVSNVGGGIGDIFGGIKDVATDPLTIAGVLGGLTYKDQARINNLIQQGYDKNEAEKLAYQQKFTTPGGIASLPQQVIAGTTPRTAADVVYRPQAAKGGSINDLYGEYSELNNRMRNYRRLAKGGLI
jgi:hypothetical protein